MTETARKLSFLFLFIFSSALSSLSREKKNKKMLAKSAVVLINEDSSFGQFRIHLIWAFDHFHFEVLLNQYIIVISLYKLIK